MSTFCPFIVENRNIRTKYLKYKIQELFVGFKAFISQTHRSMNNFKEKLKKMQQSQKVHFYENNAELCLGGVYFGITK